jgi:hypothetical protein
MAPTFVAAGAAAVGTTSCTPAFPAGILSGDILLTALESVGGQNYATPSGWAHVGPNGSLSSPVVQSTNTQLTVFWRRYDGTGTAPTISGVTDHAIGQMIAIRGCPASGNPWNVGAVTTEATSDTTMTMPTATTTQADTLVLLFGASSVATGTTNQVTSATNAALTSITERIDTGTLTGNDGLLTCYSGIKATAGAIGTTAVVLVPAGFKSMMTMAMMNAVAATTRYDLVRRRRAHPSYRR